MYKVSRYIEHEHLLLHFQEFHFHKYHSSDFLGNVYKFKDHSYTFKKIWIFILSWITLLKVYEQVPRDIQKFYTVVDLQYTNVDGMLKFDCKTIKKNGKKFFAAFTHKFSSMVAAIG